MGREKRNEIFFLICALFFAAIFLITPNGYLISLGLIIAVLLKHGIGPLQILRPLFRKRVS